MKVIIFVSFFLLEVFCSLDVFSMESENIFEYNGCSTIANKKYPKIILNVQELDVQQCEKFIKILNFINHLPSKQGEKLFCSINILIEDTTHLNNLISQASSEEARVLSEYLKEWSQQTLNVVNNFIHSGLNVKIMSDKYYYDPQHVLCLSNNFDFDIENFDVLKNVEYNYQTYIPPFFFIIQQFLHYLHFLENPIQYIRDSTSSHKKYNSFINYIFEVSEEERTLIGREENPDDISEFSIRYNFNSVSSNFGANISINEAKTIFLKKIYTSSSEPKIFKALKDGSDSQSLGYIEKALHQYENSLKEENSNIARKNIDILQYHIYQTNIQGISDLENLPNLKKLTEEQILENLKSLKNLKSLPKTEILKNLESLASIKYDFSDLYKNKFYFK